MVLSSGQPAEKGRSGVKCPKCLAENTPDSQFCKTCATRLPPSPEAGAPPTATLAAAGQEPAVGSTFAGRYQVIEELGRGGMGKVFKAFDREVDVRVALKLIRPEVAADQAAIERFRNELKVARGISHKNVCRMYDLGREADAWFITMEYVPGEDLRSFLRRARRLDVGTAVAIARQICEGLSEAHRLGVVHRDLKPANIMIDRDGDAKIMDFGIARSLGEKGLTGAGAMIGTPAYMSPEQVEGREADQRSDLYALGAILYEMVTGRAPFQGDTPLSVAMKHKSGVPKDPRGLNAQVPEGLSRIILRCLEKDREKRFPSAAAVLAELESLERGVITAEGAVPAGEARASVAVLPFEDFSPRKDQEYFCDGMTEELITRLSNIKRLKVPARTSVFAFKGKADDIREIGRKLDVRTVLEGSIRKIEDRLRVTAQLINISDGFHLWSETYDRELRDVFSIWDEIALTIADKLQLTLLGDEKARWGKRSTKNLEAYDLYLLGRHLLYNATAELDYRRANDFFEQASAKDPGFALPYVQQAVLYSFSCMTGYLAPKEGTPKAIEAAEKALALDDLLGEAHASLGNLKWFFHWDAAGAEREFMRALELSPGSADVHILYAWYLVTTGRFEEGIAEFKRVLELDPATPGNHIMLGGMGYNLAGRHDEAIDEIKKGMEADPNVLWGRLHLASAYALKGMHEEAIAVADEVISARPTLDDYQVLSFLGWAYAASGRPEKARGLLDRLLELRSQRYVDAYLIAEAYAGLGEKDKAFEWLDTACEERAAQMIFLKIDPWIENLRSDPRYGELLRKTGFEKESALL
jgi:serine/threonine protein kinase/tetratricopeptide (TPR) repeat protein